MYSEMLGHRMTFRLQRRILPGLEWNQEVYGRHVLEQVKKGARWLDLGCGQRLLCRGLENLERQLASFPFVGVDLSLENLRGQQHTLRRVQADGDFLPFPDESFDVISSNMVIEHLRQPEVTFRELNRVLAPGGTILLHTPNLANYEVAGNFLLSRIMPRRLHATLVQSSEKRKEGEIYQTFYRANTRRQLKRLAHPMGELEIEFLPAPRPFFHYFAPVALVEILMTRFTQLKPLRQFATTLLIRIRKNSDHVRDDAQANSSQLVKSSQEDAA